MILYFRFKNAYRSNEDNLQKIFHKSTCNNNEKNYPFLENVFVTDIDHLSYFRSIQGEPFI